MVTDGSRNDVSRLKGVQVSEQKQLAIEVHDSSTVGLWKVMRCRSIPGISG